MLYSYLQDLASGMNSQHDDSYVAMQPNLLRALLVLVPN